MIKNVILDWSGTVVDDLRPVVETTNAVFAEFALPAITLEEFRAEFCLPMNPFYERRMSAHSMEVINASYLRHFPRFAENVAPLPHSRAFLEFCQFTGRRLFILSTIPPDHFISQAETFELSHFFEGIYTGVIDKRETIGNILKTHQLVATETLFAGDMVHDVVTAHHAGVLAVALLSGFDDLAKLSAAEPDVIVRHLGDLQTLMERTGEEENEGSIRIEDLEIEARVGVSDEEIAHPQRLLVNIEMTPNKRFSAMEDCLSKTVDYAEVANAVESFSANGKWRLIETLAVELKSLIVARTNVSRVRVKIKKFILPQAKHVSVEH